MKKKETEKKENRDEKIEKIKKVKVVKKKIKKNITNGIAFVNATFNNTIVTIADDSGNVIAWASAGSKGFKGSTIIFALERSSLIFTSNFAGLIRDFQFFIFTFSVSIKLSFFLVAVYHYVALALYL